MLAILFTPQFGAETATYTAGPGAPLRSVPLVLTYWGSYWLTGIGQQQLNQIENAVFTLTNTGFFSDEKKEYNTDGVVTFPYLYFPGVPEYGIIGSSDANRDPDPSQGFSQAQLVQIVQTSVSNSGEESNNSIVGQYEYVVFTPPGIQSASGPNVGGYNSATEYSNLSQSIFDVSENFIWVGGGASTTFNLDTYTKTLSHEVSELTVNPGGVAGLNGIKRLGWTVTPGALFPNPPPNSGQICDYEAQNYTARLDGVDVQSYWSYTNDAYIIPDNNLQNFVTVHGILAN